jgi:hypothetical protein
MGPSHQRASTVLLTRLDPHPFFLFRDGPFWLLCSERRDDLINDSACVVAMLLQCVQLQFPEARWAKDVEAFLENGPAAQLGLRRQQ